MNLAILMAGPYRATEDIKQNHLAFIGEYDTYVSCFSHYIKDWKESGWGIKELFETPSIDITETDWFRFRNNEAGQSGFWQYWNLRNVINNVPNSYEFYIKSRCDLEFHQCQFDSNELEANTLYSSANNFHNAYWDREFLLNDQFYIGDWNTMKTIADFPLEYYKINRHGLNEAGPYVGSNEAGLREFLNERGIRVKGLEGIRYIKNHYKVSTPSGVSGFQLEKI